jgi:hypothetical protein
MGTTLFLLFSSFSLHTHRPNAVYNEKKPFLFEKVNILTEIFYPEGSKHRTSFVVSTSSNVQIYSFLEPRATRDPLLTQASPLYLPGSSICSLFAPPCSPVLPRCSGILSGYITPADTKTAREMPTSAKTNPFKRIRKLFCPTAGHDSQDACTCEPVPDQ